MLYISEKMRHNEFIKQHTKPGNNIMNTSFNAIIKQVNVQPIVEQVDADEIILIIHNMGFKAIKNGPTWKNVMTNEEVQTITLLDCDRNTFNKIKNRVALKSYFNSQSCY